MTTKGIIKKLKRLLPYGTTQQPAPRHRTTTLWERPDNWNELLQEAADMFGLRWPSCAALRLAPRRSRARAEPKRATPLPRRGPSAPPLRRVPDVAPRPAACVGDVRQVAR